MEAKEAIKAFLREHTNANTRKAYNYTLYLYLDYAIANHFDIIKGSKKDLRKAIQDFLWENEWKRKTAKYRLAAVKSFYNWLVRAEGVRADNPADLLEPEKEVEKYVEIPYPTAELADKLERSIERARDEWAIRDLAIVLLLRQTGLRSHELLALETSDIDPENGRLVVRNGKGGKPRYVAFSKVTARYLIQVYAPAYQIRLVMFPSSGNRRAISRQTLWNILRRRCGEAHFTEYEVRRCESPHSWRHLWTTEMIKKRIHPSIIKAMGGWSTDNMIQRYMLQQELTYIAAED
jgi:integrase/recombinase XerD